MIDNRLRVLNDRDVNPDGKYVLYWMTYARRTERNFALERAASWSRDARLPLLVFEPLRAGYQWATERTTAFVIDGMRANAEACAAAGVRYYPYVEAEHGDGSGLLAALAKDAFVVIADDAPVFFLPHAVEAGARAATCLMEAVDTVGIVPYRSVAKACDTAYAFRRSIQNELPDLLRVFPEAQPLKKAHKGLAEIAPEILTRWPEADLRGAASAGGMSEARRRLDRFLVWGLDSYHDTGSELREDATSGLSPYLHFGHISAHEILDAVFTHEGHSADDVAHHTSRMKHDGRREKWWGLRPGAEAFLDQVVTWRELGHNTSYHVGNYDRFESLPGWARATLFDHSEDRRPVIYDRATMESAQTYDKLWNATQNQLRSEGIIYSYVRMLWAKKVIEWSASPEEAWDTLIELNNTYALDGRDPNSYSGVAWSFGRYDRPWPERAIFGKVRYMSSENTARKLKVKQYIETYAKP